jgi:carbon-monoxide dehydrogenase small subunit
MKQVIRLTVNGVDEEVLIEPWWSLADVLREQLNLTGVKIGCNRGDCGSCTVLVDGQAVKSCIFLAVKANGKNIISIEGLGRNGGLDPLQEAFIEHFGVQCGYCTPGMILAAKALLDQNPDPTEEEVKEALRGNICRCTGYVKIVEAVLAAKEKYRDRS